MTVTEYRDMPLDEIKALRAKLAQEAQDLVNEISSTTKRDTRRPALIGKKTELDARLKLVNAALKDRNRVESSGAPPVVSFDAVEPIHLYAAAALVAVINRNPSANEEEVARMAWGLAEAMEDADGR